MISSIKKTLGVNKKDKTPTASQAASSTDLATSPGAAAAQRKLAANGGTATAGPASAAGPASSVAALNGAAASTQGSAMSMNNLTNQFVSTLSIATSAPVVGGPVAAGADQLAGMKSPFLGGILLIHVIEAKDILMPADAVIRPGEKPYCVVEFDKNEAVVEARKGTSVAPSWDRKVNFDVQRDVEVLLSVSIRQAAKPDGTANPDLFLGSVSIMPNFKTSEMLDGWHKLTSGSSGETTLGSIHLQSSFSNSGNVRITNESFELLKVVGKGSFGKVMQVRKKDTGRIYAMKIIRKSSIIERSEVEHTLAERNVLAQIQHPFVVNLKFSFQSPEKLYLVLAFVNGGELFHHLQNEGVFSEDRARFYTAELLEALECLHKFNIIYRDLKPENILLDYTGHIALCDFGLCKLGMQSDVKTNTFCGTPEYLAPELLLGNGYTKVVDWWTLGVLLFEMITGLPPFYDENTHEMYKKILNQELKFPGQNGEKTGIRISIEAKDILKALLERDPTKRLGNKGAEEIKHHGFFAQVDWTKLYNKRYAPPFRPNVASETDTSNFDEEFTSEMPTDSVVEGGHLSKTVQEQFMGFTYQAPNEAFAAGQSVRPR